jgi:hypothetical protein
VSFFFFSQPAAGLTNRVPVRDFRAGTPLLLFPFLLTFLHFSVITKVLFVFLLILPFMLAPSTLMFIFISFVKLYLKVISPFIIYLPMTRLQIFLLNLLLLTSFQNSALFLDFSRPCLSRGGVLDYRDHHVTCLRTFVYLRPTVILSQETKGR